jgi:GNAT superfamily N-acetyltransferase
MNELPPSPAHQVNVRLFEPGEWRAYKDLRLQALAESPDAFGSTFAREAERTDAEWAYRLASGARSAWDLPLIAMLDACPIGLAWGKIETSHPEVANLYQVWVHPDHRKRGAGQLLLEAVIDWAKSRHAAVLELDVTLGYTPAARLYYRNGFRPVGEPVPLRPGAELLEQKMRLRLNDLPEETKQ